MIDYTSGAEDWSKFRELSKHVFGKFGPKTLDDEVPQPKLTGSVDEPNAPQPKLTGSVDEPSAPQPKLPDPVYEPSALGGVLNIGNTCYLGAAIQTLANVSELSDFLLSNEQRFSHVPMVRKYAQMLRALLERKETASPQELKEAISATSTLFVDNVQHDSQEFLQFFLDALHESLKKVPEAKRQVRSEEMLEEKKAAVEGEGGAEHVAVHDGDGMWQNAHNQWKKEVLSAKEGSTVLDLFAGQFLSKLHCPNCAHSSNTFELFTMLQLQIPVPESIWILFKAIRSDINSTVVRYAMRIPMTTELVSIKQLICDRIGITTGGGHIIIQNKSDRKYNADVSRMFNAKKEEAESDCTLMGMSLHDIEIWCFEAESVSADYGDRIIEIYSESLFSDDSSLAEADWSDVRLLSIDACLKDFTSEEQIDGSHCDNCKSSSTKLAKQLSFTRLPGILVICFKRFIFVPSLGRFSKQGVPVSFPLDNFDPSPYFAPDVPQQFLDNSRYFCIGIVTHHGQLNYGHYCSYVRDLSSNKWIFCNDSKTLLMDSVPNTRDAYIVFYQRRADVRTSTVRRDPQG
ncbi:CSN-associated deubiquitinating enzyme Ubp12 [Globodera pallida]|nr:CSN-associated deubiquitinating enzyme Ubp12 [Globodera pallida]